tara:strand:- start:1328 stop:1537 length:210 start_codon:yes stop_codon:yes gene_type:complete
MDRGDWSVSIDDGIIVRGKGKAIRRKKKMLRRKRQANRKQLLNVGSYSGAPKWFRRDALKGARRLRRKK